MDRQPLTEEEILAQIPTARRQARMRAAAEPRAASARYDAVTDRIEVHLTNGCVFAFPARMGQGLEEATPEQLARVQVDPGGEGLHWEELDADISLPGLMARALNLQAWAARYLGQRSSARKAAAARVNGKKGGRPRKNPSAMG